MATSCEQAELSLNDSLHEKKAPFIGVSLPDCPLSRAKEAPGIYFRLLPSGSLSLQDFKSRARLFEEGSSYIDVDVNICEEHAVSLCTSLDSAIKLKRLFKRYKNAKIAEVVIQTIHGKLDQDKPGHANWGHHEGFDPCTISQLAAEEQT